MQENHWGENRHWGVMVTAGRQVMSVEQVRSDGGLDHTAYSGSSEEQSGWGYIF